MPRLLSRDRERRACAALLAALLAAGCSTDDSPPICVNCEDWRVLTTDVSRYAEPHPSDTRFAAYSTIEKTPNAPDANRESDEDLWLVWIRNLDDPTANFYYQITGDELETGDNFYPRWNPAGTELAFVHSNPAGDFEVWRVAVALPVSEDQPPVVGVPERIAAGRDPAWLSNSQILFVRNSKIFSIDVVPGAGRGGSPVQLSFNPPPFATNEQFVDRHPAIAPDGGVIFDTVGRQNVADLLVEAFAIDESVAPPETTATEAFVSFQSPTSPVASYPVTDAGDTLRTPTLLQSVPVREGGDFEIRVRRDSRFLPPLEMGQPTQVYCDTFLTKSVNLAPDEVDAVQFYFRVVRGDLLVRSGIPSTTVNVERQDGRTSLTATIASSASPVLFGCLIPFEITPGVPDDVINTGVFEPFVITATRGTKTETRVVDMIPPGETTNLTVFPVGGVSGTVVFSDDPSPVPQASLAATEVDSAFVFVSSTTDTLGDFRLVQLTQGSWDIRFTAQLYDTVVVSNVAVSPPTVVDLGNITLTRVVAQPRKTVIPAPSGGRTVADEPLSTSPIEHPRIVDASATLSDGAARGSAFRAPGDVSTVWRLDLSDPMQPSFQELFGLPGLIQNPALTSDLGDGLRYVAFVSNVDGDWELYIQRLSNWQADGEPVRILTPGTSDNLDCTRKVFHPRWIPGASPPALLVTMTDCPDNGFEDLGFDEDPWAIGEIRLWRVETTLP